MAECRQAYILVIHEYSDFLATLALNAIQWTTGNMYILEVPLLAIAIFCSCWQPFGVVNVTASLNAHV